MAATVHTRLTDHDHDLYSRTNRSTGPSMYDAEAYALQEDTTPIMTEDEMMQVERELLTAWQSRTPAKPSDAQLASPAVTNGGEASPRIADTARSLEIERKKSLYASEFAESVQNMKNLAEKQRRLEELQLSLDDSYEIRKDMQVEDEVERVWMSPTFGSGGQNDNLPKDENENGSAAANHGETASSSRSVPAYVATSQEMDGAETSSLLIDTKGHLQQLEKELELLRVTTLSRPATSESSSPALSVAAEMSETRESPVAVDEDGNECMETQDAWGKADGNAKQDVDAKSAQRVSLTVRTSRSSSSLQWHSSKHSYIYEPVKNTKADVADLLVQIQEEYEELTSEPFPSPKADVSLATSFDNWNKDAKPADSVPVTVKKFHLPMGRPKYMQSLLMQVDDPKVKERLREMHKIRQSNAAAGLAVLVPYSVGPRQTGEFGSLGEVVEVNEDGDDTASQLTEDDPSSPVVEQKSSLQPPPRRIIPPTATDGHLGTSTSSRGTEEIAGRASVAPALPSYLTSSPASQGSPIPVPPVRRSSICYSSLSIPSAPQWAPIQLAPTANNDSKRLTPLTLHIPPPPRTFPPQYLHPRLSRMGVMDLSPRPAGRPSTLGRTWGDPTNVTSFVTPVHSAPERLKTAPSSITGPQLVSTSARIKTVPINNVLRELQLKGKTQYAESYINDNVSLGSNTYGTAQRAQTVTGVFRGQGSRKRSDVFSVFEEQDPLERNYTSPAPIPGVSMNTRTATVYPSPPGTPSFQRERSASSPQLPNASGSHFTKYVRKVGKALKTAIDPYTPPPQTTPPVSGYATADRTLRHSKSMSSLLPDQSAVTFSQAAANTGDISPTTLQNKRSAEMEKFRQMLIETYSGPSGPAA
ncbi:uncharacterized protein SPPG_04359 [Spizellomyces punctatus DAOM BR117]|uniref:Uncharacterized protein n=1 Tax=Spizellomyces punctatus (strain DAOM BR117) TaxID=645134 RepID=A0A0L0HG15_SPIPD|nr:uncharacterized protein SPPG_04359 [Spizellomyces punctatus DAOM BR117]KND00013.1 hypothetical protein SPPG_04359 [Spizellomyces punctatus DAOM BR117]|eukprot:XP_016608052.1 hypothetical protein SPPG_04359 [Spizellomyces punctatus DAOM BR117]